MKMIRALALLLAVAVTAGCGGGKDMVKKTDLALSESRLRSEMAQELAAMRKETATLKGLAQRLELLEQEIRKVLKQVQAESQASKTKIDRANTNVVKDLEIQEQYLKQQLESIRALLDELKK